MTRHKVKRNEFRLANGAMVNIDYWTDDKSASVAAFDMDGNQVSRAVFHASVASPADFGPDVQKALVDSLANALEYALTRNPDLHVVTV
ncbi:MAG TPA: hypothetical protein VKC56_11060 [Gallionellaceae bacterium]|nr:hypothetical protein [Gallionellaceae bacterium]